LAKRRVGKLQAAFYILTVLGYVLHLGLSTSKFYFFSPRVTLKELVLRKQISYSSALSIIVPVRIDVPDRLENLRTSTAYLRKHFPYAEMIMVECDESSTVPDDVKSLFDEVLFVALHGPFAKSRAMNLGLLRARRPVVAFYDVDVLVHPSAARWAVRQILTKRFPLVLPFSGVFVDVSGARRREMILQLEVGRLALESVREINAKPDCTARIVDGGVFFADREVMIVEGGYNARMISYGWEDIEVLRRFEQLGYYRAYAKENLIHLDHARGPDSVKNEYTDRNRDEYERVKQMSRAKLRTYVINDLAIAHGPDIDRLRHEVRARKSRSNFGPTRVAALVSKIASRIRHGSG